MLSAKQVVLVESQLLAALPDETKDITEPKRTPVGLARRAGCPCGNPALRTSEIRYRRLFEAARDGILILNAATLKITDANPFMSELLGYSRDEFLGKQLWQIGFFSDKEASKAVSGVAGERLSPLRRFASAKQRGKAPGSGVCQQCL